MKKFLKTYKKLPSPSINLILLGILILTSSIPRLWKIEHYPPVIVDEPANLRDIELILQNGFKLTDFHWDNNESRIALLPAFILIRLGFDKSILTLRYSSVLLSLLSLIPFHLLVKRHTGNLTAFLTTLLFSWSYYFLQFSRVGWTNIAVITVGMFYFLILEYSIQIKNWPFFLISGFLGGLLSYLYSSAWVYIFSGFFYIFLVSLRSISQTNADLKEKMNFTLFLLSFLITASPWLYKIYKNWDAYLIRYNTVSIKNTNLPYHGLSDKKEIYLYQAKTTIKSWIILIPVDGGGHENPRYLPLIYPPVNNLVRFGFWVGIILAFFTFSKTFYWYLIIFFGLIFGQILTVDPPNGARGLIMLPFFYLFFSLSLNKFFSFQNNNLAKILASIIIFILIYLDFWFYRYWMTWINVYRT